MNNSSLALLGGTPILKKPFPGYNSLGKQELGAVIKAMKNPALSGFIGRAGSAFLGGPFVKKLEKQFTNYFNVKYAVSFNSATTALHGALVALGIGPGDEVITSPYTMSATSSAILLQNAVPLFADISEDTFCLDPRSIKRNITAKTKAIIVVNLFGGSADYDPILKLARKHSLYVIEDNAQSITATYKGKLTGTIGDIGIFSFNQNKVIHCGEGGMLITNNDKWAFRAQLVRNHGEAVIDDLQSEGLYEVIVGTNYRLVEPLAAIASEQFKKVELLVKNRIMLAEYLTKKLGAFDWIVPPRPLIRSKHVYYVYPFRFLEKKIGITRQTFVDAMGTEGFALGMGYQKPLYLLPLYQKKKIFPNSHFPFISREYPHHVNYQKGICPITERLYERELLFTTVCQPPQTQKEINLFIAALKKVEANIKELKEYELR